MDKYPNIVNAYRLINEEYNVSRCIDDNWFPARAEGYCSLRSRVKCAWMVFTGKADALLWERQ